MAPFGPRVRVFYDFRCTVDNIENKDPVAPWGGVRVQAASCKTAAARAVLPINNLAFSAPTQKNCHFMIPGI